MHQPLGYWFLLFRKCKTKKSSNSNAKEGSRGKRHATIPVFMDFAYLIRWTTACITLKERGIAGEGEKGVPPAGRGRVVFEWE